MRPFLFVSIFAAHTVRNRGSRRTARFVDSDVENGNGGGIKRPEYGSASDWSLRKEGSRDRVIRIEAVMEMRCVELVLRNWYATELTKEIDAAGFTVIKEMSNVRRLMDVAIKLHIYHLFDFLHHFSCIIKNI